MKEALTQAIRHSEEQSSRCPVCRSEQVQGLGTKRRVLLTSFGRVEVPLKRLRFRPADRCLSEVQGHNVTPDLRDLAALVGSSWPYETAAGVLKRLSGVQLSDERLRQLTNEQGSALAKQQLAQAQQVLQEAVSLAQIRAQGSKAAMRPSRSRPSAGRSDSKGDGFPRANRKAAWKAKSGWLLHKWRRSANMGDIGSPSSGTWPPLVQRMN